MVYAETVTYRYGPACTIIIIVEILRPLTIKLTWASVRTRDRAISGARARGKAYRYIQVFPCRGEQICTYISGSRCTWWQKTMNQHIYTHGWDSHSNDNNKDCSKR